MMLSNPNAVLSRLIKDVNDIKSALRRSVGNLPLYDIANENTPDPVSVNQNNYQIGNYDILRINATTNVSFSGFTGGVKGRFLEILNVGAGKIKYLHNSTNSNPENRLYLPYGMNVDQLYGTRVRFYYDISTQRWTLASQPNSQGYFGKTAIVTNSSDVIDTIPTNIETKLTPDTITLDEWGYYDMANSKFRIPSGEFGLYIVGANISWVSSVSGGTLRQIRVIVSGVHNYTSLGVPNIGGQATNMFVCNLIFLTENHTVEFHARQDSGGDLNCRIHGANLPAFILAKIL